MYKLFADYHTHTVWSHGKGSVQDNVNAAMAAGLETLGISDHAPGHLFYGVRDMQGYMDAIHTQQQICAGKLRLLAGIELNLTGMHGQYDLPVQYRDQFDFVIMGFHKGARPADFTSFFEYYIARSISGSSKRLKVKATDAYIAALMKKEITILSHPGYAINIDKVEVAKACLEAGTLFEINTSHTGLEAAEIVDIAKTGVKFLVSSDAHVPDRIAQVDVALQKAIAAGLSEKEIINIRRKD